MKNGSQQGRSYESARVDPEGHEWARRWALRLLKTSSPRRGAEKIAVEIATNKIAAPSEDSEHYERRLARRQALIGLRQRDERPLREGIEKGLIRPGESTRIRMDARRDTLAIMTRGFGYRQFMRVWNAADDIERDALHAVKKEKERHLLKHGSKDENLEYY